MKTALTAEGHLVFLPLTAFGPDPGRGIVPRRPAGWLELLEAGSDEDPELLVELVLGKLSTVPKIDKGTRIYVHAGGVIRCRVLAHALLSGVHGYAVVLRASDIARASPMTVAAHALSNRWRDSTGEVPLTFWKLGGCPAWWNASDEERFLDWAGAGLPLELAERARPLAERLIARRRVLEAAPTPPTAPAARASKPNDAKATDATAGAGATPGAEKKPSDKKPRASKATKAAPPASPAAPPVTSAAPPAPVPASAPTPAPAASKTPPSPTPAPEEPKQRSLF